MVERKKVYWLGEGTLQTPLTLSKSTLIVYNRLSLKRTRVKVMKTFFFSQALLPTNISKFTESLINSDLSLNP